MLNSGDNKPKAPRGYILRLLLYTLLAVGLLYALVPRMARFHYEFQKGKVWTYATLRAPYDYPLYMRDAEWRAAKAQVVQQVSPIFRIDTLATAVSHALVLERCEQAYRALLDSVSDAPSKRLALKSHGWDSLRISLESTLDFLYHCGVVSSASVLQVSSSSVFSVLRKHVAYETRLADTYTPKRAEGMLSQTLLAFDTVSARADYWLSLDLVPLLRENLVYDSLLTRQLREEQIRTLSRAEGMVQAGTEIIARGEVVTEQSYQKLESLRQEFSVRQHEGTRLIGIELAILLLFILLFAGFYGFLWRARPEVLLNQRQMLFLLLLVTFNVALGYITIRHYPQLLYLVPLLSVPFLVKTFVDGRVAFAAHLLTVSLVALFASNSFEYLLITLLAGTVALFSIKAIYRRGTLFLSVTYVFFTYVAAYALLQLLQDGSLLSANPRMGILFAGNALLTLTVYPLMYPIERMFGFVSNATLMELSDVNQPLLRELGIRAPGTFQHSMQVATLAEEAILEIGGNALLVRAGALYHDIGKLDCPEFFTENQDHGINPHNNLPEEESAEIIIAHVEAGVRLAKKHKLPHQVIDFIRTHHGTTRTEYFYRTYKKNNPNGPDRSEAFTYPGPRPFSRETATLMMADSVEAASRSLDPVTEEAITALVEGIINYQQIEEQYNDSNITFRDIEVIKKVFIRKLLNIYHTRIAYPADPNRDATDTREEAVDG